MLQKLGEIGGRNRISLTLLVKVLFVSMFLLFPPFQFSNYKIRPNKNHMAAPHLHNVWGFKRENVFFFFFFLETKRKNV